MRFRPITNKYNFDKTILIKDYPNYLIEPIANWIKATLVEASIWNLYNNSIDSIFLDKISINLRERFPRQTEKFIPFVFEDSDRITNVIGICLQNYSYIIRARELENILANGGSGYSVMIHSSVTSEYEKGMADLVERVPEVVNNFSEKAVKNESLLAEAWYACYSKNPDYDKVVSKSVDVLEGLLRDNYFPKDSKPVLTRFINDFVNNPKQLIYKGSTLVKPANLITDIGKEFIKVRGQHTKGTGRQPTKEEAEFVLHYTIFVWNMHN